MRNEIDADYLGFTGYKISGKYEYAFNGTFGLHKN
jgi:hypothetical protein